MLEHHINKGKKNMCDKCEDIHKHYVCVCGKEFETGISIQRHKQHCKEFKLWKIEQEEIARLEKESKRLPNGLFKCENPDCNNEHDGSYGSGRFCCKKCAAHVRSLNSAKSSKLNGTFHRKCNFNVHKKNNGKSPYGTWKCERCDLIFETRRLLLKHNRDVHNHSGHGPIFGAWNKGLSKETDVRVANNAKAVSKSLKIGFKSGRIVAHKWSDEEKKQHSELKKKLFREHPEKHPNVKMSLKGFISKPEKIAKSWLLEHAKNFIAQYRFEADDLIRYVDFYIPDRKLFIEIDGSYWHQDVKELDLRRRIRLHLNMAFLH